MELVAVTVTDMAQPPHAFRLVLVQLTGYPLG
jgi:hypothetical protein